MSSDVKKGGRAKAAGRKAEGIAKTAAKEVVKVEKEVMKEVKKEASAIRKRGSDSAVPKPTGHAPVAMVMARHGTGMISRPGKGFSLGEVSSAGIDLRLATRWGLGLDRRRRSVLEGNVSSLKQWGSRPAAGASARKGLKEVEERAEEVAKEVEEDVEIIEEEVKKAGGAAKKEVKRGERAVKEKVERTRSRKKSG